MNNEELLIPKERIPILIGKQGQTKKDLEQKTHSKINIDSQTGNIEITNDDALQLHKTTNTIKAIARGFSPEKALLLLTEEYYLEIINLVDTLGKNEKTIQQKRGRIIGTKGKTRDEIETQTGAKISVYGKTISIIGKEEQIERARKAINMLLEGAAHNNVYKYLNEQEYERGKLEL